MPESRQGTNNDSSDQEVNFIEGLTAVFGSPVAENPTILMMDAAFQELGLTWRYLNIEVPAENLEAAVEGAKAMNFKGFNLTIPHKVAVIDLLDELGEAARKIGAVNCVIPEGKRLIGRNTDGKGFLQSLQELTDPKGKRILMFGAGGAARAISTELALAGAAAITIVNRSNERGRGLVDRLVYGSSVEVDFMPWQESVRPEKADIVINATSMGLYPEVDRVPPLDFSSLSKDQIVADVIPNPPSTKFLARAKEAGAVTLDGLGMLVNQGRVNVEYWSGKTPDAVRMRAALEDFFGKASG
ncbi:MAG: shikimate dehydrogenase [Spirochaetales bacterium]|nr:shikimate dehydrogenase [Spirochaetales bacterium]MCF7939440.1 shikimate dehydrogenase [Spirochaetales bacterium]